MNQNRKSPAALEPNIIFTTLRGMISKKYQLDGEIFTITEVIEYGKSFKIYRTNGNKVLNNEDANAFINACVFVENEQPEAAPITPSVVAVKSQSVAPTQEMKIVSKQDAMLENMADALYDVFNKIKQEPTKENIEQGTALSNTANTVCGIWKLRLQAEKMSKR
jgi:hypothetical protein